MRRIEPDDGLVTEAFCTAFVGEKKQAWAYAVPSELDCHEAAAVYCDVII